MPVWRETHVRDAYQASLGPRCSVYFGPAQDQKWRWRVGWGDLTTRGPFDPIRGDVIREGVVKTRAGAKRAALRVAKTSCPDLLPSDEAVGRRRRR